MFIIAKYIDKYIEHTVHQKYFFRYSHKKILEKYFPFNINILVIKKLKQNVFF